MIRNFTCRGTGERSSCAPPRRLIAALCTVALLLLSSQSGAAIVPLPELKADSSQISVSGLSSGGFMAVQFEVAYSSLVKGAGVIAGGPYYCAQDNITRATTLCSCTNSLLPCQVVKGGTDVQHLIGITRKNAQEGKIDAVSHLSGHRIYMFSGAKDTVMPQPVMDDLETYYKSFLSSANIQYQKGIPAQHAMPTDFFGSPCDHLGSPFINNCGFDAAGELLKQIYGTLKPKSTGTLSGALMEFDQKEFIDDPGSHSMDDSGWVYVPDSCRHGHKCKLHIAFHGCKQGHKAVGMEFIEKAGYNQWADTNNIIILYPQVISKKTFGILASVSDLNNTNPEGCWNWWGYDKDREYATKHGLQIAAVKSMTDRITGSASFQQRCFTATNSEHIRAGRAHRMFFIFAAANGSNQYMGLASRSAATTLKQTGIDSYVIGTCQ